MELKETIVGRKALEFVKDNPDLKNQAEAEQYQAFALFHILREYDASLEDVLNGVVDGGNDLGIDAIYSIADGRIINSSDEIKDFSKGCIKIIQIKAKNRCGFEEDVLLKLKEGVENIFGEDELKGNTRLKERARIVRSLWEKSLDGPGTENLRVQIDYVSIGASNRVEGTNDRVVDKKEKIIERLREAGLSNSQLDFIGSEELLRVIRTQKYSKMLLAEESFECVFEHNKNVQGHILIVDGNAFFEFITDDNQNIEDRIFEDNVRDYQGDKKEVVKNIKSTIKSDQIRGNFWCMNNGVTILTTSADRQHRSKFMLKDYQIINGCQTSYGLFEAMSELNDKPDNLKIIVRLIETSDTTTAQEIIQATNSQIPIDKTAIRAQEEVHKSIEEYLKRDGLYYERRRNFHRRQGVHASKIIEPKRLFQIIRSIYFHKPSSSKRSPSEFFENKDDYKLVFSSQYDPVHYRIACVLYMKVVMLSKQYKKENELSEGEITLINNGLLHISRILFSLLVGEERVKIKDKRSETIKTLEGHISRIEKLGIKKGELFDKSLEVLISSVGKYGTHDTPIPTIIKNSKLEEYIDDEVKRFLGGPGVSQN